MHKIDKTFFGRFVKNSLIFFVGSVFSKIISFVLLPFYTSKIPATQMGEYDTNVTIITIIASLCFFEIWTGVLRFLYAKKSEKEKEEVIISGSQIFFISSLFFIAIALGFSLLFKYRYPFLLVAYMLLYMLSNLFSFIARGRNRNIDFAISGCICSLITLLLNILLISVLKFDYSSLYISQIAGFSFQCLYLFIKEKNKIPLRSFFRKNTLNKTLFLFCIPLSINAAAYWCLSGLNRIIYNYIYGNEASGIFAIGSRFSSVIVLVTTCFSYAWQDLSFSSNDDKKLSREKVTNLYSNGCFVYLKFLFASAAILIPTLRIIFPIFINSSYSEALSLIPFFIISSLLNGFSSFLGGTFYAIKDTKSVFITTIIGVIINAIVVYPLITAFNANGANTATIIAFIVMIVIRILILKRKIDFRFKIGLLVGFLFWAIFMWTIFVYFDTRANLSFLIMSIPLAVILFKNEIAGIIEKRKKKSVI